MHEANVAPLLVEQRAVSGVLGLHADHSLVLLTRPAHDHDAASRSAPVYPRRNVCIPLACWRGSAVGARDPRRVAGSAPQGGDTDGGEGAGCRQRAAMVREPLLRAVADGLGVV